MQRTKRIFISDIHIGTGKKWDRFQHNEHEARLCNFFHWVKKQEDVKDLVLLGDIFDTWIWPYDKQPETVKDILKAKPNKDIFESINAISKESEINVLYCNGNHDQEVRAADLKEVFPEMRYIGKQYDSRPVFAEHGHRHDLFNAPGVVHKLPLGYFITRILTKADGNNITMLEVIKTAIDDFLEMLFTAQTISESVLEAVMEVAGVKDNDKIVMPGGNEIAFANVNERYKDLYKVWKRVAGSHVARKMILGNFNLEPFAEKIADDYNYRAIVMGHTHRKEIDKDQLFVYDHIYANSGCWVDKSDPNFVVVDKKDKIEVTLYSWNYEVPDDPKTRTL